MKIIKTTVPPFYSGFDIRGIQFFEQGVNLKKKFYDFICKKNGTGILSYFNQGLAFMPKFNRYRKAFAQREHYCNEVNNFKNILNMPHPIDKDRRTYTFNRFFSFYKVFSPENNKHYIVYALRKSIHESPDWRPFFVEGMNSDDIKNMSEMIADGCNWMGRVSRDNHDEIFYKKTHKEKEVAGGYQIYNLCDSPLAKIEYFSLPIIKYLKPKQLGERLKITQTALWAMSHAGKLKNFIIDTSKKVFKLWGVTTISTYENSGTTHYDSFVSKDTVITQNTETPEKVLQIDRSESSFNQLLFDINGNYTIRHRHLDYDVLYLNPFMWLLDRLKLKNRKLPLTNYDFEPIPEVDAIFGHLTSVSTGPGHLNTCFILSVKWQGELGVIYKRIKDKNWNFYKTNAASRDILKDKEVCKHKDVIPKYRSKNVNLLDTLFDKISCKNYNLNTDNIKLKATINGEKFSIYLVQSKSMFWSFFGYKTEYWELYEDPADRRILPLFRAKHKHKVNVDKTEENLTIILEGEEKNGTMRLDRVLKRGGL